MRRGSSHSGKEDNGYAALVCLRRCLGENWQFSLSSPCELGERGLVVPLILPGKVGKNN